MDLTEIIKLIAENLDTTTRNVELWGAGILGFIIGKVVRSNRDPNDTMQKNFPKNSGKSMVSKMSMQSEVSTGSVSLTSNGASVKIDLATFQELKAHLERGDKIGAIKLLRESKNTDLKDAKDLIESLDTIKDRFPQS